MIREIVFTRKYRRLPETWEHFTNNPWDKKEEAEEAEDEWAALREAAERKDLCFNVSHGQIHIDRETFTEDANGVDEAWQFIEEVES